MQFFLLVIINIVMGAFLYLVISLKLEKSASEFREKKLKKFMDEIITEFNVTAERNIALLENRISVMKKMLVQSGEHKSIDMYSEDIDLINGFSGETDKIITDNLIIEERKNEKIDEEKNASIDYGAEKVVMERKINTDRLYDSVRGIWDRSRGLILRVREYVENQRNSIIKSEKPGITKSFAAQEMDTILSELKTGKSEVDSQVIKEKGNSVDIILDREDISEIGFLRTEESDEIKPQKKDIMSETKLVEIFSLSDDKYSLLQDLSQNGYELDILAKCSGIPVGEVKLVLNLKNP